jgi:hypothetical protein
VFTQVLFISCFRDSNVSFSITSSFDSRSIWSNLTVSLLVKSDIRLYSVCGSAVSLLLPFNSRSIWCELLNSFSVGKVGYSFISRVWFDSFDSRSISCVDSRLSVLFGG